MARKTVFSCMSSADSADAHLCSFALMAERSWKRRSVRLQADHERLKRAIHVCAMKLDKVK